MNETVRRQIEENGARWAEDRDRSESPLLLVTRHALHMAFELSLPKGEGHPFWRVNERPLTEDERADLRLARSGFAGEVGDLISLNGDPDETEGPYMRVCAYIYNGRQAGQWNITIERVKVRIKKAD